MMQPYEMEISSRAKAFCNVVANSICTNKVNERVELESMLMWLMHALKTLRKNNHILYIVGNGGSAAVASHALVDFVNVAKIHTQVLHECSLITCMANDFGYENVFSRVLETRLCVGDILIAISSSGKSKNICNAAETAARLGCQVITFSGFQADNPLRRLGDVNFWLNSCDYGYVEVGHQFLLHNLSDRFGVEKQNILMQHETMTI